LNELGVNLVILFDNRADMYKKFKNHWFSKPEVEASE